MNISKQPRRSRKPIVGTGSIILAAILAYATLRATGSPLLASMAAGIPTYIAPAYFAWKREPFKAYASAILAAMISGGIAWLVLAVTGQPGDMKLNPISGFVAGLFSAGFLSHLAASAYFTKLLYSVTGASPDYPRVAASFLAVGSSTVLGFVFIRALMRPREVLSPSIILIIITSIVFLALSVMTG